MESAFFDQNHGLTLETIGELTLDFLEITYIGTRVPLNAISRLHNFPGGSMGW